MYVERSLYGYMNFAQDELYRGKGADNLLRMLMRRRGFNDYSGNLSRSYYVKVSRQGASYTFVATQAKPAKGDVTRGGKYIYYLRTERHVPKGPHRTYRGRGYHKRKGYGLDRWGFWSNRVKLKQHFYRYFREGKEHGPGEITYEKGKRSPETWQSPSFQHERFNTQSMPYLDRVTGPNKRSNPSRRGQIQYVVEVGNDTPYAPMVEARGYHVLSPETANEIRRRVAQDSHGIARAAVRNMVYDIKKQGYSGWFDKRNNPFTKK